MEHPRLTDSQLRDLQPGARVSRYSRPGEVQTAPVQRLTDTQIVVTWPDTDVGRYHRESGVRVGAGRKCQEVLRMPGEETGPETEVGEDASVCQPRATALLHCSRSYCPVRIGPGSPCPGCGGELTRLPVEPSVPGLLPVELLTLSTPCPVFYAALGPLLASVEARKEGVEIWHRPGKTWVVALIDGLPVGCGAVFLPDGAQAELASAYVLPEYRHQGVYRRLLLARTEMANAAGKTRIVATCTSASAAILARLGFAAIGESAGYTTMSLSAK